MSDTTQEFFMGIVYAIFYPFGLIWRVLTSPWRKEPEKFDPDLHVPKDDLTSIFGIVAMVIIGVALIFRGIFAVISFFFE